MTQATILDRDRDTTQLRQQVIEWLSQQVGERRLNHILRVEQMSIDLAKQHNLSVKKAAIAGLMHDLAKNFPPDRLLKMARDRGLEIDIILENNPHLLHAEVGAIVARDEFGIEDEAILSAIGNHTLGRPEMSPLSCAVFLADSLEPGRGDTPELNELRREAQTDLYLGVWRAIDWTIGYLIDRHLPIHPRAVLTRNWALRQARSSIDL